MTVISSSKIIIKKISISLLAGLVLGALLNEISFLFLHEQARAPQVIELVIPQGTAEMVARGETDLSIPENMDFVVGDILRVVNDDNSDHQLGPLWIPAGASASLLLDTAQSFAYDCSFQPSSVFGIDVHNPLTISTRLGGILFSGIPFGVLIAVYSLVITSKKEAR